MEKKKIRKIMLRLLALLIAALFVLVIIMSAKVMYEYKLERENFSSVDFYKMQAYSAKNSKAVMKALRSGKTQRISRVINGHPDVTELMDFADWRNADYRGAVSLGAGSLSTEPDGNGRVEINEKFVIDSGDERYILFIETTTSRWGRKNEGVNAVAVCNYDYYDSQTDTWNGEKDDETALAGTLFPER